MSLLFDTLVCSIVEWTILLVTGWVPSLWIVRRLNIARSLTALIALGFSGLAGWLTFWAFFTNPAFGFAASTGLLFTSLIATAICVRNNWLESRSSLSDLDAFGPLLLILFACLAYNGILFLAPFPGLNAEQWPQVRFFTEFTPDNLLPFIFAEKLAHGTMPTPLLGDWLSSDRPPLQTGITLLQWPFAKASGKPNLCYQIISTLLQLAWLPAVWALSRALKLNPRRTAFVVLCCLFNGGFFFFNSVYSWPKLVAGSFAMLVYILVFHERLLSNERAIAAGVASALAMLAHGGSIFGLFPIGLVAAAWLGVTNYPARIQLIQRYCLAAITAGVTYIPWVLYQKLVDPPGDRLVKFHLGGITDVDSRPAFAAIQDAYASLGWEQFLKGRIENIRFILEGTGQLHNPFNSASAYAARYMEWQHHGATFGVLMVGFLLFPLLWVKRDHWPILKSLALVLTFCGLGLAIWVTLMFEPGSTKIHHGSYLITMTLIMAASASVSLAPRFIRWPILVAQAACFAGVWCVNLLGTPDSTTRPLGIAVVLGILGIALTLRWATHSHEYRTLGG